MPDRSWLGRDLRPEIDELGRVYLAAMAWRDERASDRQLVRLRTLLGTILTLLGWRAHEAAASVPQDPGAGP